jgi:hypothetical protein
MVPCRQRAVMRPPWLLQSSPLWKLSTHVAEWEVQASTGYDCGWPSGRAESSRGSGFSLAGLGRTVARLARARVVRRVLVGQAVAAGRLVPPVWPRAPPRRRMRAGWPRLRRLQPRGPRRCGNTFGDRCEVVGSPNLLRLAIARLERPCRIFSYVAGLEREETVNHFSVAANVRSIRSTLRSSARSRHLDAVRNVCNRLLTVVNSMYPACGQEALACVRRLLEVLEISPCPRSGAKHRL